MPLSRASLIARAKRIRILATDIDGVMTGGEVIVLDSGEEVKFWNSKDRLGLALLRDSRHPLLTAFITGRSSPAVKRTAKDLGIHHLVQHSTDKLKAFKKILKKHKLALDQAAFIGDDLVDLSALRAVGFAACPGDAVQDVKKSAHYISKIDGGRGVVRDVLEFILRAQKKWDHLVAPFRF